MATSPEDIVNMALRRLGNDTPIGFIYEGSKAARAALELYGQTRDALLRLRDWPFARRDVAGTTNGQVAPHPWQGEFVYPADCLRVRNVASGTIALYPVYDPRPILWTVFNDQRLIPAGPAILSSLGTATIIYTSRIIDPTSWEPLFTETLVEALARRLAVSVTGSADILKGEAELSEMTLMSATDAQDLRSVSHEVQMQRSNR